MSSGSKLTRRDHTATRNTTYRPRRRHGGWSLLELLVVAALSGVILSALALTLGVVFRADRQLRSAMTRQAALERFGRQLRVDAHRALGAETRVTGDELRLLLAAGRSAQYRTIDSGVERRLVEGDRIRHRELFRLPGMQYAGWEKVTEPGPLVRFRLSVTEDGRDSAAGPDHVFEAALGLDVPSDWRADIASDPTPGEEGEL